MKPRAADLFCCAGGASMGLHLAGFDVVGWDIKQGLHYPFFRHIGDALDADLTGFDFVWASPPCQRHSSLRALHKAIDYRCRIETTREKLKAWGGPYIIENVEGAPLVDPVLLCGSMFGLRVRRHRIFESNVVPLSVPACRHEDCLEPIDVTGTGGRRLRGRHDGKGGNSRKPLNLKEAREAMGMPWAERKEISQAIPPAFSEYLGKQVIAFLNLA